MYGDFEPFFSQLKDLGADSVYTEAESGYANMDLGTKLAAPEIIINPPSNTLVNHSLDLTTTDAILTSEDDVEGSNSNKDTDTTNVAENTEGELGMFR